MGLSTVHMKLSVRGSKQRSERRAQGRSVTGDDAPGAHVDAARTQCERGNEAPLQDRPQVSAFPFENEGREERDARHLRTRPTRCTGS